MLPGDCRVQFSDGSGSGFVVASDIIINECNYYTPLACVFPNSAIQTGLNLETKHASELKINDSITYYDFNSQQIKLGTVSDIYIHKKARSFVKYEFEDGTYLEATDYHPIYTKDGWKSLTRRYGYEKPEIGDEVESADTWKKITKITTWTGLEDCYDFAVIGEDGKKVNNYFANGTLVQSSI